MPTPMLFSFPRSGHTPAASTSRRRALLSAARLAAVALAGGAGLGQRALALTLGGTTGTSTAQASRALSRVGYGPSASLVAELSAASSAQVWALQQVDAARVASQRSPVIAVDLADFNAPLPQLVQGARQERELRRQLKATQTTPAREPDAALLRHMDFSAPTPPELFTLKLTQQTAAWRLSSCSQPETENPLLARMTEFWFNHLNVFNGKGSVRPFVGHYLVNVIRAHAMGRFEDLLLASARHPAMLMYLDQAQSVADGSRGPQGKTRGLNENYARELMELHTLGADAGYTQTDVHELARVLSGWTVGPNEPSGFRFNARLHDNDSKRLLGQTFPSSPLARGEQEGVDAIRMLARHPATAHRISLRLAQFFVADKPDAALVRRLSQTFLTTQGDISAVLRSLFASADFWDSANTLFKTPLDFVCASLTVMHEPHADDRRGLVLALAYLASAGQPLHGWPTPDGYTFDAATWMAPEALTRRADFALALARQHDEPEFLKPFLSASTLQTIAQERAGLRAGLMIASPDFMTK